MAKISKKRTPVRSRPMVEEDSNLWLVGGSLAALAGLGVAIWAAAKNREYIGEVYEDLSEKASDMLESGEKIRHKWMREPEKSLNNTHLMIGGIAGGLLGLGALYFLRKEDPSLSFSQKLRHPSHFMTDDIKSKATGWVRQAKGVINSLDEILEEEEPEEKEDTKSGHLENVIELATLGYKIFQNIKQGR